MQQNKKKSAPRVNTTYDDVFRTILTDATKLILPVLNEIFGEHYTGEEVIINSQNEHFITLLNGMQKKRINDASFTVHGATDKKYIFECQSTPDKSILVRIFEYAANVAREQSRLDGGVLHVELPRMAILYLRSDKSVPSKMKIRLTADEGALETAVRVMKLKDYTSREIVAKNMFFLLPFVFFLHEKQFALYNKDNQKLKEYLQEVKDVVNSLCEKVFESKIDAYTAGILLDMAKKVNRSITRKYVKVQKGVANLMGGKVLEYPTKTAFRKEYERGQNEGREKEKQKFALFMLTENYPLQKIVANTGFSKQSLMELAEINHVEYKFV